MFQGTRYDSTTPPPQVLPNAGNTSQFSGFIAKTITDRLRSGAIQVWGKVGEIEPPQVVSPITVEPTKPRMCIDMRYLNLWMRDTPFQLDSLLDIPRIASNHSFMSKLDDKSGYDHVSMTTNSYTYLGFEWDMVGSMCQRLCLLGGRIQPSYIKV